MAENEKQQRSVRKLTVRNFSVIKEAELEFGKITVLIGPQASGKSLLCKLAYFLSRAVIERAEGFLEIGRTFSLFEEEVGREFERWFPLKGWGKGPWRVNYAFEKFEITVSSEVGSSSRIKIAFGQQFREKYGNLLEERSNAVGSAIALRGLAGKGVWDSISYIPAERDYFVDTLRDYKPLVSDPSEIIQAFALRYKASLDPKIPKPRVARYLGGKLVQGEEAWEFQFRDGRVLPLNELSSGHKVLLPMLSILAMYEVHRPVTIRDIEAGVARAEWFGYDDFFVEEPEGHIFPDTQREIVQYLAEMINSDILRPHFTITTHSPYILSAFNNLILAGQLGQDKKLKKKIKIDEKYWIEPGSFRAYRIHDGVLKPILSKSGLIDGDYLDSVSESIGGEFDELLRLEYGKKKAS